MANDLGQKDQIQGEIPKMGVDVYESTGCRWCYACLLLIQVTALWGVINGACGCEGIFTGWYVSV